MPWRGVGIGVMAIQRSPAGSYISVASKMRKGASPPKTRMRSGSAAAARPPRPRGNGAPVRQAAAEGPHAPAEGDGGQVIARRRHRVGGLPDVGGGIVDLMHVERIALGAAER